jgi:hypothetical protein
LNEFVVRAKAVVAVYVLFRELSLVNAFGEQSFVHVILFQRNFRGWNDGLSNLISLGDRLLNGHFDVLKVFIEDQSLSLLLKHFPSPLSLV